MRGMKFLALTAVTAGCFIASLPRAEAQVNISIGVAPECPYGYYGPEWFTGGVFIGAGPWFHGAGGFRGQVNNTYHPQNGYKGPMPNRGERAEPAKRVTAANFKGNEERDGRGHATGGGH